MCERKNRTMMNMMRSLFEKERNFKEILVEGCQLEHLYFK